MASIKDLYEDSARTTVIFPRTHENAVVDNNGTTSGSKFSMLENLINQKQMAVGAVPSDTFPKNDSTNWVTSGAIRDKFSAIDDELYETQWWKTSTSNAIRNGSVGNTGNTNCVSVTKIIDVSGMKKVKLMTNRPNSTNCVYRWVFTTFSVSSGDSNIATNRIRIYEGYGSNEYPIEYDIEPNEIGVAFGVTEYNTSTDSISSLRKTDFSDYFIGMVETISELKENVPVLQSGTNLTIDVFKMDVGSGQANSIPATLYGGSFTSFPIEITSVPCSITIAKPTITINETAITLNIRVLEYEDLESTNGTMLYNSTLSSDYTFSPSKRYVRISFIAVPDYDLLTWESVFNGFQVSSTASLKVLDYPTKTLPKFECKDVQYIPTISARGGSVGNSGNSYAVCMKYILPTYGYKYAMVYTDYAPAKGYELRFSYNVVNVASGDSNTVWNTAANQVRESSYDSNTNNMIANLTDGSGVAFSIVERNMSNGNYTAKNTLLAALDKCQFGIILFNDYSSLACFVGNNTKKTTITELNGFDNIKDMLGQMTRYPRVNQTTKTKPLVLMHFSDIHGGAKSLSRMIAFKNEWSTYIDDILNTGDTILHRYSDDWTWFTSINGSENILMTLGNHDALAATSGWDWTNLINAETAYTRYMAGIANWGVTYQANKCYYYKDYSTEKIRLIVLDCMLWDNDELTWLQTTLAGAKTNNYSVVCVSHYPADFNGLDSCSFNSLQLEASTFFNTDALDAVDTFINGGGKFVTWIVGHTHMDLFGTIKNHPNQTIIGIDTCSNDADNLAYSDVARVSGTKSEDLFNIVAIDTWNKTLKVMRVGADYDFMMRHKGTMCWDYENKQLLWNS